MNETILIILGTVILFALMAWGAVYYAAYAVRSQFFGATVWCGNAKRHSVALTFDDGPSPDTPAILEVLKRENVRAAFFLIGEKVEEFPDIVREIAAAGHDIGNHSYSHPIFLFCTPKRTLREMQRTQEIIKETVGFAPSLARPPCGVRTPAYFDAAEKLSLQTVMWSDTGFDWKNFSGEQIAEKVLETVQSNSIILLHDGDSEQKSDRTATAEALPIILRGLREKGLRVAPIIEVCPEITEQISVDKSISQHFKGENQI